jgi:hypothetical protein
VKKSYHTIGKQGKANEQELARFLSRSGQFLLPMVDLVEQCQLACDELIDVTGRAAIRLFYNYPRPRWREVRRSRVSAGRGGWCSMAGSRASCCSATASWKWSGRGCGVRSRGRVKKLRFPLTAPCRTASGWERRGSIKTRRIIAATSDRYRAELLGLK